MADTFTAILELTKPEVGASLDTWGTKLNDNFDDVDALFSAGPVLKVANGGTAATTASGARTSLGLGTMATQAADNVAITGGTAALSQVILSGATPSVVWAQLDGATDEKYTYIYADSDTWDIRFYNDAQTSYTSPILIARTGTTVDSVALSATTVTINGSAAFHAGTFTAPSSGTFTASLRESTFNGTVIATGAAYWKKFNNVVTLRLPEMLGTTASNVIYITGLPAEIQVGSLTGAISQTATLALFNNTVGAVGWATILEANDAMSIGVTGGWTASSGSKGTLGSSVITYQIAD